MKYLFLSSLFFLVTNIGHSADLSKPEIEDFSKKALGMVKNIEVEKMLDSSIEFVECKTKAKFESSESEVIRNNKIIEAQKCFKDKLSNKNNAEQLKKLSEDLNLESYGLVQSKSANDLQNYLSSKMYKSLTGIDPEERDRKKLIDSMDFNNKKRKLVDQKVFLQLYNAQLIKNALFEISNYCFSNLRIIGKENPPHEFAEHWDKWDNFKYTANQLTDIAKEPFGGFDNVAKEAMYEKMFNSIQGTNAKVANFEGFFEYCASNINDLCKQFEDQVKDNPTATTRPMIGANSCITKSKLVEIKKALAKSKLITVEFDEMSKESISLALSPDHSTNFFGKNKNDESIDDLTSYTSDDLLNGGNHKDQALEEKQKKCEDNPGLSTCEDFISVGDGLEKVENNYVIEMTLKKEVEMARVRELVKGDKKTLKEYLESNGYFEILNNPTTKDLNNSDELMKAIGNVFEARKLATLDAIKTKMGKRQFTEKESKEKKHSNKLGTELRQNVNASKSERARLAQVVLFNNIITSYIDLEKKGTDEVGRNVNAWKKEKAFLESSKIVDASLFSGLDDVINPDDSGFSTQGSDIQDLSMLDTLLGKAPDPNAKPKKSKRRSP